MISIKANVTNLIHRAILSAFPIKDSPVIRPTNSRDEVYQYDYICEAPKEIFEKHKIKNTFFGLSSYKEVADDIKVQVPRNPFISKIETTQNGALRIKIDDKFIKDNIPAYKSFITSNIYRSALICLPGIPYGSSIGYEYFRGMNIAEKIKRMLRIANYKTRYIMPIVDTAVKGKLNSDSTRMEYSKLFQNSYFNFDPEVYLTTDLANEFLDYFNTMKKDYYESKKSMCTISLLLYFLQAKYSNQNNLIFISSHNQQSFMKNTLKNFESLNEKGECYRNIKYQNNKIQYLSSEFYFGGLLLEKNGRYSTRDLSYKSDQLEFEALNYSLSQVNPKILAGIEEMAKALDLKIQIEEIVKGLDACRPPISTQNIGPQILEEFMGKIVFLFLDTYRLLMEQREIHRESFYDSEMDDLGRLVSLKLLRFNEVIEEVLISGDMTKMFRYWEDFAKLWWNIINTKSFDNVSNKGILLKNSLMTFDNLFNIFFGVIRKDINKI